MPTLSISQVRRIVKDGAGEKHVAGDALERLVELVEADIRSTAEYAAAGTDAKTLQVEDLERFWRAP